MGFAILVAAAVQTVTHEWKFGGYAVGLNATGGAQETHAGSSMSDVVRLPGGTYRIYYGVSLDPPVAGAMNAIRSATSPDGLTWTIESGYRLLGDGDGAGPDGIPADEGMVNGPRVVQLADGTYRMYYQASTQATNPPDFRVKSATSPDGLAWTREGTRIDITYPNGGAGQFSLAGHCAVIRFSDTDYVILLSGNYGTSAMQPSDLVIGTSADGLTFSNFSILYAQGHDPFVVRLLDGSGYWVFYGNLLLRQRSAFSTDGKTWPASTATNETIQYNSAGTEITEASTEGVGDRALLELANGELLLFGNWGNPSGNVAILRMFPGSFTLTSPTNGATGQSQTPTLTWTDAKAETSYTLQVATENTFAAPVYQTTTLAADATTTAVPAGSLQANTTYLWRVIAVNNAGQATASNAPFTFTTAAAATAPGAFTLASPSNGATDVATGPTLTWTDATGETGYTVQISQTNDFATTAYSNTTVAADTTTLAVPSGTLLQGVLYYWRVIAANGIGQTTATNAPFSFTTTGGSGGGTASSGGGGGGGGCAASPAAGALALGLALVLAATSRRVPATR